MYCLTLSNMDSHLGLSVYGDMKWQQCFGCQRICSVCSNCSKHTGFAVGVCVCVFVSCEMEGCVLGQCETQHKCMSVREYEYAVMHSFFFSVLPIISFLCPSTQACLYEQCLKYQSQIPFCGTFFFKYFSLNRLFTLTDANPHLLFFY